MISARRYIFAILIAIVILCFSCIYTGFDPLLNLISGARQSVIPDYPGGLHVQTWIEHRDHGVHRITTFQTSDTRDTVIRYYDAALGLDNQRWQTSDFLHAPYDPSITKSWFYEDYCPYTIFDATVKEGTDNSAQVKIETTQYSCRDGYLDVIKINLFPWAR